MPVMNGEIPSTPITTLAGAASLTDLLPELPLPTALPQTENQSLLPTARLAQEAQKLLTSSDPNLVSQLVTALRQSNTDHIQLLENVSCETLQSNAPVLLKSILSQDPNVFQGNSRRNTTTHFQRQGNGSCNYTNPSPGQNHYEPESNSQHMIVNGEMVNGPVGSPIRNSHSSHNSHTNPPYTTAASPAQASSAPHSLEANSPHVSSRVSKSSAELEKAAKHGSSRRSRSSKSVQGTGNHKDVNAGGDTYNVSAVGGNRLTLKISKTKISSPPTRHTPTPPLRESTPPPVDPELDKPEVIIEPPAPERTQTPPLEQQSSSRGKKRKHSDDIEEIGGKRKHDELKESESNAGFSEESVQETNQSLQETKYNQSLGEENKVKELSVKIVPQTLTEPTPKESDRIPTPVRELQELYATSVGERTRRRSKPMTYNESSDEDGEGSKNLDSDSEYKPKERVQIESAQTEKVFGKLSRPDKQLVVALDESVVLKKEKKKAPPPRKSSAMLQLSITLEDVQEQPTYKRFMVFLESALETVEDMDISAMKDDEDETDAPTESLLSRSLLTDLCSEAAKLKSTGATNLIPAEKAVKLLAILQWTIKDGCKVLPTMNADDSRDEEQVWREIAMEKVLAAVDAALTSLYIMTSPRMPKEVYLEDVIEKLVMMTKVQLQNSIYPDYDPVYKVDPSAKDGFQGNIKSKRAHAKIVKHRTTVSLYNKLVELLTNLSELIDVQQLTDTIILQVSTLAVTPFFVENISELQLNALKLVTSIFTRYEKHRQLILEDIFASLQRLPSSKRNLRSYRLNSEENIQMVTALCLELIQCVVKLPKLIEDDDTYSEDQPNKEHKFEVDKDVVFATTYETSMRTAHNFLAVFLKKCTTKSEEDYRPIFENFVQDLLSTVNKPEWPAAELMLSLLGRLLVKQFSNKSVDMSLRVASLDYLGTVAARLRKDAVTSQLNEESIQDIIRQIEEEEEEESKPKDKKAELDRAKSLQHALLNYLWCNLKSDPALVFSVRFYIAQWYRDSTTEMERKSKQQLDRSDEDLEVEVEMSTEIVQAAEKRRKFLVDQVLVHQRNLRAIRSPNSPLDYEEACLTARYLAANRPFSQSFDIYLSQILKVLSENAVAVRTKAMKCLTAVVEADPGILARVDMQKGVHGRFLDQSTSVREAAVELVGKFILIRPELTSHYYEKLSARILDTGISVRKRVIKIFRDVCIEQPDFDKIPEMCVRMIRRVNDEDGIKKLVNDVFQELWFQPLRERDNARLLRKVMNITDVVAACKESGYEWFEQLVDNLLKKEEESHHHPVHKACEQIVDCLVDNVLRLEEIDDEAGTKGHKTRLVACLSTLYLFCKVKPELLVNHTITIHPYLNIKCNTQGDLLVLHNVTRILELSVPLMDHPSEHFLSQLEEDMMKLILKHGMMVLQSCVSFLGAVVNQVTHNYKLVRDCFQKFFGALSRIMSEFHKDNDTPQPASTKSTTMRALFTVGLLCKHFDFDSKEMGETRVCIKDKVFDMYMHFLLHPDADIEHKALTGLGFYAVRHYDTMMIKEFKDLYSRLLNNDHIRLKLQVLHNLELYLIEEEEKMMKADAEWKKVANKEDLKEMGDVQSGMASTIMQVYLKQVLEALFNSEAKVRQAAINVVILVLKQGLVHPVQCVPYLVSMGTDCEGPIRNKADQQLQEIEKKYPGFIQMKAVAGIKMSYRLQKLVQKDPTHPVRGLLIGAENISACNSFIYSLIRGNRGYRRALLTSMLNMFDDTAKVPLKELLYLADNLAYFPYQCQDESLYIVHQIDILVSVSGSNIVQAFREYFYGEQILGRSGHKLEEDDDEEFDYMLGKILDVEPLQELYHASQGCLLLLTLKQHLKELYGLKDNKIHQYSPTEAAKTYEKPCSRKNNNKFEPVLVMDMIKEGPPESLEDETYKKKIVQEYLDFKALMMSIDPADDDEDDDAKGPPAAASTPVQGEGTPRCPDRDVEGAIPQTIDLDTSGESHNTPAHAPAQISHQSHTPSVVNLPAHYRHLVTGSSSSHRSSSDRKRSHHSRPKPIKVPKKKKKKKKRWAIESDESEDDSGSDPDWA